MVATKSSKAEVLYTFDHACTVVLVSSAYNYDMSGQTSIHHSYHSWLSLRDAKGNKKKTLITEGDYYNGKDDKFPELENSKYGMPDGRAVMTDVEKGWYITGKYSDGDAAGTWDRGTRCYIFTIDTK